MATTLEDLVIRLKADSSELERELRKSGVAVNRFSKQTESGFASISSAAKKIGATLAVAFAVNKLREFASAALELGSSLNDTAARLGTTAESLQIYRLQAKEAGVDSGAVDSSLQSFSKTLGQLQAGLGRATKQLAILDPTLLAALKTAKGTDEAYRLVADAIRETVAAGDEQRAAAIAQATGMAPLLGVLKEGADAFDTFGERARASGLVLSNEAARGLDAFGEALDRVKQTALVGFAEGLAGADAGAQSFTATLSDPEMLQGLHDLAAILGTVAMGATKVAVGFEWAVRATREMLGILPHVQGAIPPNETVWERNKSTMPGVLPPDTGQMSYGKAADLSSWAYPGSATAQSRPRGTAPAKGGKGGGNKNPTLDYSITHFKFFETELKNFSSLVDGLDKDMKALVKTTDGFADEGVENFRKMEQAADAFGSLIGNVVSNLVRDGKLDFKSLAMSFAESLIEMEVAAAASSLFKSATKGSRGGEGSSALGSIFGFLMSAIGIGGAAEGGHFTKPTLAMIGEGKESEWALPDSKLKGLLAASGGRTVVNVHNYGNEQVTTKSRQSGGQEVIDVMVGRSIRRQLGAGALKDEFGRRHAPGVS